MKKTLAAVAVLGAFAGSALAADVTLYGIVDLGLAYSHIDSDISGQDAIDRFEMKSGQQSGSRWGLKGEEDLGNGLTVGFILESGFNADTGTFATSNTLFNRESSLYIKGGFGKLAFGRIGSINQGTSSWALAGNLSAFGTSFGDFSVQAGNSYSTGGIWDNMIAYQTPTFAGFTVYAQYSMGNSADGAVENESSSDRYYAIGATYANGPFLGYLAVDSRNYKSWDGAKATDTDDSLTVTLGGNYDFEVAKVYLGLQYFDEVAPSTLGGLQKSDYSAAMNAKKLEGYSVSLSAGIPVAGGTAMIGATYIDAEAAGSEETYKDDELTRWAVSAGYDYPFSKRTNVYAIATYMQDQIDSRVDGDRDPSAISVFVGMRHKF